MKKLFAGDKSIFPSRRLQNSDEQIKQNLTVIPVLQALIPPLTDDEFEQLRSNIRQYGCRDSLKVWVTTQGKLDGSDDETLLNVLVDGHNRYAICRAESIEYPIQLIDFENFEAVRLWMIDNQIGRRNLTPEQRSFLVGSKYNSLKKGKGEPSSAPGAPRSKVNVANQLAQEHNMDPRSVLNEAKVAEGVQKLHDPLKRDYLAGKTSISKKQLTKLSQQPDVPNGSVQSEDDLIDLLETIPVGPLAAAITTRTGTANTPLTKQTDDRPETEPKPVSHPRSLDMNSVIPGDSNSVEGIMSRTLINFADAINVQSPALTPVAASFRQLAKKLDSGSLSVSALVKHLDELAG